jgi:hypothetical protein
MEFRSSELWCLADGKHQSTSRLFREIRGRDKGSDLNSNAPRLCCVFPLGPCQPTNRQEVVITLKYSGKKYPASRALQGLVGYGILNLKAVNSIAQEVNGLFHASCLPSF